MKVGTKSLLFGVHQFAWHPFCVFLAWCELYGLPNWKETACIIIHDWGYWECENMDGVGQGADHPFLAARIAYKYLDGLPNWKETACIIIHDWGYRKCENMDGVGQGADHPFLAARIAYKYLDGNIRWMARDNSYSALCLYHSRGIAKEYKAQPSKLCWADKLSIKYDPWFLYLPRALLSGEIKEYRKRANEFGEIKHDKTNKDWYQWSHDRMIRKAYSHDTTPPYEGH